VLRIGTCKLCLRPHQVLQRSHLMGRALYRMSRDPTAWNPNPIVITRKTTKPISRQIADYLLCHNCERLLNENGEAWMVTQVFNGRDFPLMDRLNVAVPIQRAPSVEMFSGTQIGLNMERLAYFALSVFWRGSVHRWRLHDGSIVFNPLGAFEEPIRRFLVGEAGFPTDVSLVAIACTDSASQGSFYTPAKIKGVSYTGHGMLVRGVHFRMFTGTSFPQVVRNICCYTGPQRPIMKASCQRISLEAFRFLHATSRPSVELGSP